MAEKRLNNTVIKELMEHADKYGIVLSKDDVYPEPIVTTVKVDRPITDLASWSINMAHHIKMSNY